MLKRIIIKSVFLIILAIITFGFYLCNNLAIGVGESRFTIFLNAMFAISSSVIFWGILSNFVVSLTSNLLIGVSVVTFLWFQMNSTFAQKLPVFLNIFSYGAQDSQGKVQAMLTHPKVLIVDEPTAGVDPEERIKIRSLLADFGKSRTIIFSTHTIEDLAATCHDLCILNKGEVKYNGSVEAMLDKVQGHSYSCTIENEKELLTLQNEYFVTGKVYNLNQINVRFISEKEPTISCKSVEPNLEDAYIYINNYSCV